MRVPVVRFGDPTTTRGRVLAVKAGIHDDGKKIALHGEHATCGNCKGSWPMFGTGYGMSDDGTQVVIQGDRVLCPCGKNRVIAGDDVGCFVHKTIDAKPRDRDGAKILARSAAAPETYDEQYTLKGGDGRALAGVRYRIVTDRGRVITGTTNGFGETERIATDETERLKLYATGGVSNE